MGTLGTVTAALVEDRPYKPDLPEVGRRYTNSAELHDDKGLKHRPDDEVRPTPIPPELVEILRWHLGEFGVADDGRLFRQPNGNVAGSSTYTQVRRAAQTRACS